MIKSENFLQELFEDSRAIVLVTDEQYNIRYSSSAVESILGLKPVAVAGKNVFEFAPAEKRDQWRNCLEQAGKSKYAEIHLKSAVGEDVYFDVSVANRVAHHEIRGLVIMLHDITSRKRENLELEREKEHLDQFIFKTTHDLRAPIHSAMGLMNLLEHANGADRTKYFQMVRDTLDKLESLIEEVNHLYRVGKMAVSNEKIDLRAMLEAEIDSLKNYPNAWGIRFELDCIKEADLFSDPLRVKTVIGNILSNAVKYSDLKKVSSRIQILAKVTEENLELMISDNGIGIAKESIGRIFDIFFRANTEAPGTGLGLHIVKDTIERLKGSIQVESQLGIGTQFKISLPNFAFSAHATVLSGNESKAVL